MFSRTGTVLSLTRCFRHHQPPRSLSLVSSSTLTAHLATRSDHRQCQSRFHQQKRLVSTSTATTGSSCIKMTGVKKYQIVERGAPNSTDYRVFFKTEDGQSVSPLHDIPLYANDAKTVLNMVVEVPRWTNAKMEISLGEGLNPIKQDVKKGKLRFVANCFPHHGYIWNYGAFPQTWENPDHLDPNTGCKGDNDPIDVLEIGSRVAKRGDVVQVKVLGTVALIDEGETDWKVISIDVNDPVADQLNDINDVEKVFPGLLKATVEWFKIYKIPDGKPENQFAFNGEAKDAAFANKVVEETHKFWLTLINKEIDGTSISCLNTTVEGSPYLVAADAAEEVLAKSSSGGTSEPRSDAIHKWHFREENAYSKL
ncbi:inorganic pyrophosphatase isoform X2 [Culex pipiens pallens]|uniref:inorganic pyrophosphatase isoform X2 n=1 Tax=Culex pipiens pallens TaxID=42434 RepID=UPI0019540AEC|nr:inorganic pyrophosphatase isoform X2 [Culex pipiens pallens]